MDTKAYIDSGILELYVAGALSETESKDVYALLLIYPELLKEVQAIESAIVKLTAAASPSDTKIWFTFIKEKLNFGQKDTKVIPLDTPNTNYFSYMGWAASVLLAIGLFWMFNQNTILETKISTAESNKVFLEFQIEKANTSLAETKKLISVLRDRDIIPVPLDGQVNFSGAYAKVYWDKSNSNIYLDVQGLPTPPEGKVYQIWSLTLNPLSPTSLGTLDDFNTDENKIFALANPNSSQAFGITLEPAGGSESPTMEQLYTLGVVSAS